MQRTVTRPSVTWLLLVALLVISGVLTAAKGLGGVNKVATCTGYGYGYGYSYGYSSPAPKLTLAVTPNVAPSGARILVSGQLTQNGCVLAGETITLKRRAVVNGVATGSFVTVKTLTTGATGVFATYTSATYNSVFQAFVSPKNGRPAVVSPARVLRLTIKISAHAPVSSHLVKAKICGSVAPSKVGKVIALYRGVNGVWKGVQLKRVLSNNSYCFALVLPKGKTPIKIRVGSDDVNLFGQRAFYVTRT